MYFEVNYFPSNQIAVICVLNDVTCPVPSLSPPSVVQSIPEVVEKEKQRES